MHRLDIRDREPTKEEWEEIFKTSIRECKEMLGEVVSGDIDIEDYMIPPEKNYKVFLQAAAMPQYLLKRGLYESIEDCLEPIKHDKIYKKPTARAQITYQMLENINV